MDHKMEITKKNIFTFFNRYLRRVVKPYTKSEPIPETQEGPIIKVVAYNYKKIVLNKKKDVFVMFYT